MNTEEIRSLAKRFREAILRVPPHELDYGLREFPRGACGDTSRLFATYLTELGVQGFSYVWGSRWSAVDKTSRSHAWLRKERLIVDLTADQFADGPGEIVVEEDCAWHATFDVKSQRPISGQELNDSSALRRSYRKILDAMQKPASQGAAI